MTHPFPSLYLVYLSNRELPLVVTGQCLAHYRRHADYLGEERVLPHTCSPPSDPEQD